MHSTLLFSLSVLAHTALAAAPPALSPLFSPGILIRKNLTRLRISDGFYGTRDVSYFVTSTGNAIIDGDVLYGTEEQLLQHTHVDGQVARAFSVINQAWPGGVLTYKYASNDAETKLKAIVDAAIQRWLTKAPYLTFKRLPGNNNNAANGVVTITATDCDGCWSNIGYANNNRRLNLQQACSTGGRSSDMVSPGL